jgi:CubicO group peptidase (beta-lactamase class C family)
VWLRLIKALVRREKITYSAFRRTIGILTTLLTLSLTAETSTYAQQMHESNPTDSVKHLTSFRSTAHPLLENAASKDNTSGPREAKEVEAFLDAFFSKDAIKQKAEAVRYPSFRMEKCLYQRLRCNRPNAKSPVDASRTTFRVASVSKVFTAAAIMQLVDQGKISLQDNIEEYLDGYKLTNPFDVPVTIENLLTHTSGFEGC